MLSVRVMDAGPFTDVQRVEVEDFAEDAVDTTLGFNAHIVVWPGAVP